MDKTIKTAPRAGHEHRQLWVRPEVKRMEAGSAEDGAVSNSSDATFSLS